MNAASPATLLWPIYTWLTMGALVLCEGLWIALTPLRLAPAHLAATIARTVICCAVGGVSRVFGRQKSLASVVEGAAFLVAAWPVLRLACALGMSLRFPLADQQLSQWDRALGFDWLAYAQWLDGHPVLLAMMNVAYVRLVLYSAATFIALAICSSERRAVEFGVSVAICGLAVIIIGSRFPALAEMEFRHPAPGTFTHIAAGTGSYHLNLLRALRTDPALAIPIAMPGLVTFPSYHTAVGTLAIYFARDRISLFLPVLCLNVLMIGSTPILGGHYLVDLIAGAGLALGIARIVESRADSKATSIADGPSV